MNVDAGSFKTQERDTGIRDSYESKYIKILQIALAADIEHPQSSQTRSAALLVLIHNRPQNDNANHHLISVGNSNVGERQARA
jgi:hypothetical protein